jgi:hypothetical protein
MGKGTFLFGCAIFLILSLWDIFTGIVGISSALSGTGVAVQNNLFQMFIDLMFNQPGATFLGFAFALVVVFVDFYIIEKYNDPEYKKSTQNKIIVWAALFFWAILKWMDFSTTVVGTAKVLGLKVPPKAEIGEVWDVITANSWTQMFFLIILSLVITCSHFGVVACLKELRKIKTKEEEIKKAQVKSKRFSQ